MDNSEKASTQNQTSTVGGQSSIQSQLSEEQCLAIIGKLRNAVVLYHEDLSKNKKNKKIHKFLKNLYELLEKPANLQTIQEFYTLLNAENVNTKNANESQTNFEMIQNNTERSSVRFALGVTLIALTIITGIIPGLIALAVMYQKGYQSPMRFFKPLSVNFKDSVDQVEKEIQEVENRPQGRK